MEGKLEIFQGFEERFPPIWLPGDELTLEEKIELADFMMDRWQSYKEQVIKKP